MRVGVFQLPPMVFMDDAGNADGFYIDLIKEVAARENWQLTFVPGTWAEGLQRGREGSIDLVTTIIPTADREQYLDFCQEEVMLIWGQVFARRSSGIQNVLDLEGATVAIMQDDLNGQNFITTIENFGVNCRILVAATHDEVFRLVEAGEALAGVAPNLFGFAHAHQYGLTQTPIIFHPNPTTFAGPAGLNQDLLAALDRYLKRWKANQGSIYYLTLDHWFNHPSERHRRMPGWLTPTLVGVVLISLLLLLWNRILNQRVRARTRQLDASEKTIRAIFDQSFLFIGLLNTKGILTEVNRTAVEFSGVQLEDVLGKPFWEGPWWNHDPALQEQVRQGIDQALAGQTHIGQATHLSKDGQTHNIEYTIKPVFNDDGQVVMLIPEGHDVTERERLTQNLQQAQRMEAIGTLAGGIAHDFNNILTAISGFNDLALEDAAGQPVIEDSLQEVSHATDRAKHLVQQILTFSRRKEVEKSVFAPALPLKEAVKLLRSSLPSTIAIQHEIHTEAYILADPTQLHQVIMNLGTNAFHAMEETGGTLHILLDEVNLTRQAPALGTVMPVGKYVRLEVLDNGCGMDPSLIGKIFEPYYTSKDSGKGTGLGLSVVHGIVKSSHGFLQVESEPGQGTAIRVFFPRVEEPRTQPTVSADDPRDIQGRERILFVDDEVALTGLADRFFTSLGYRITVFSDSAAAWKCFAEQPDSFDLLITDQTMPALTGVELARRVRGSREDIPIVICSGYNEGITPADCQELGICGVLPKPLLMRSLAAEVRKILGHQDAYLS
nr:transporter substrate-binding domain-containing protein [Candidatus Krumholzibacteria bacterium]